VFINKNRKVFFPSSTATATKSFFYSFIDEKNESFDNIRFKVVNPEAYPSKDVLEMQIRSALKHSSEDKDSIQENNSLPKILDETCKIKRMQECLWRKPSVSQKGTSALKINL
jgi:hypothetical protein